MSVTAAVSSSHSTTGNAGELMIKRQLAPYASVLQGQSSKVRDDKGLLLLLLLEKESILLFSFLKHKVPAYSLLG